MRPLVEGDGHLELGRFGERADAVEYAVEMRRFDERATMAQRCGERHLTGAQVDAVAGLLSGRSGRAGRRRSVRPDPF